MKTPLNKLTYVPYGDFSNIKDTSDDRIASSVYEMLSNMRDQRQLFEANALENWRLYLSDSAYADANLTEQEIRTQVMLNPSSLLGETVKQLNHNNVSAGKAVEIVESATAYLLDAIMPTKEWFKYESLSPDSEANAEVLTWYLRARNEEWQFRLHLGQHVRQACIAGVSVFELPHYNNRVNYNVLDVLNFYWDLTLSDVERSPFIKRSMLDVGEVLDYVASGYFSDINPSDLTAGFGDKDDWVSTAHTTSQLYRGLQDTQNLLSKVACYEYWGTLPIRGSGELRNVVATVVNGKLARIVEDVYPTRPFIITPYLPVLGTSFGIGCLQQTRGQAVASDKVLNALLDGIDARNLGIYTLLEDEVLRDDDLKMAPGDIIRVRNPQALQRLPSPDVDVNSSLIGLQTLSTIVGQTSGINSVMSSGYARQSERTTATEVREARNAAGTRMLEVYHVFNEAFALPYLRKMAKILAKFTDVGKEPLVNIKAKGKSFWVKMHAGAFEFDSAVAVYGTDHHEHNQRKLDNLVQFLTLSGNVPQIAESINWPAVVEQMVKLLNLPENIVVSPETAPAEQGAPNDVAQDPDMLLEQDQAMQNMLQANQAVDNGAALASSTFGFDQSQITELLNNVPS